MSDAALSECRPAALENPAPSMKAAAGKTWGGEPSGAAANPWKPPPP